MTRTRASSASSATRWDRVAKLATATIRGRICGPNSRVTVSAKAILLLTHRVTPGGGAITRTGRRLARWSSAASSQTANVPMCGCSARSSPHRNS